MNRSFTCGRTRAISRQRFFGATARFRRRVNKVNENFLAGVGAGGRQGIDNRLHAFRSVGGRHGPPAWTSLVSLDEGWTTHHRGVEVMRKKVALMLASAAFAMSPACSNHEDVSITSGVEAARKKHDG